MSRYTINGFTNSKEPYMAFKKFSTKGYSPFGLKFDGDGFYFKANSANDKIKGTRSDDHLSGGGGRDQLNGGAGNDLINGGAGNDILTGGSGVDTFVFSADLSVAGVDRITDFNSRAGEKIMLNAYVFEALEVSAKPVKLDPKAKDWGKLAASNFIVGSSAKDANDHIIYDRAKGALFYDADGNGSIEAVQFAQLKAGTALSAENLYVF